MNTAAAADDDDDDDDDDVDDVQCVGETTVCIPGPSAME